MLVLGPAHAHKHTPTHLQLWVSMDRIFLSETRNEGMNV